MPPRINKVMLLLLPIMLITLIGANAALAEEKSITPTQCSIAILKGVYIYSSIGFMDGKPYAESGREIYDGEGNVELTYSGTGGVTGTMRTKYSVSADCIGKAVYPYGQSLVSFISPDGSRFSYINRRGPGDRSTALSGWEIRVSP